MYDFADKRLAYYTDLFAVVSKTC